MKSRSRIKLDFEHRMEMWLFLDKIFEDVEDVTDFVWIFSSEDRFAHDPAADGYGMCAGVCKGVGK